MLRSALRLTAAVLVVTFAGLVLFAANLTRAELTSDDYAMYSACLRGAEGR